MGAFGEKLRKQREQRGLALDAISNTTKISIRMLRALEEEHFDQLPGGVFNKGFVRAYARQVGLDGEESVADYLTALRESQIQQQSILPDFRAPAGKSSPAGAIDLRSIAPPNSGLPAKHLSANDGGDRENLPRRADRRKKTNTNEDRRNRQQDVPSTPAPTAQPVAHLPQKVSPQRYPAGSPAQPAGDPSARIPWGTLAAALLLVTVLLAFWNFRHRRDATAASSPVTAPNQPPAPTPSSAQPSASTASLTVGKASPAGTLSVGTKPGTLPVGVKPAGTLSPGTVSAPTTLSGPSPTLPAASPSSKPASSATSTTAASLPQTHPLQPLLRRV